MRCGVCVYGLDEFGGLYAENLGERCNRQQTNVYLSAFQRSHSVSMKVRKLGKAFLR
jgi:hypothetical protein